MHYCYCLNTQDVGYCRFIIKEASPNAQHEINSPPHATLLYQHLYEMDTSSANVSYRILSCLNFGEFSLKRYTKRLRIKYVTYAIGTTLYSTQDCHKVNNFLVKMTAII